MKRSLRIRAFFSAIVVCSLIPRPGDAQTTVYSAGRGSLGYLGIVNLRCNCTFGVDDDGNRDFKFRSNPTVLGVYDGSPADGSLRRGDVITAIDGSPLTSADGGRKFANIRPGQQVKLDVVRGSSRMSVSLRAGEVSEADSRSPGFYTPEASGGTWVYDLSTPAFPAPPAMPAYPSMPATPAIPGAAGRPAMPATPAVPATPAPRAMIWSGVTPGVYRVRVPPAAMVAPVAPLTPAPGAITIPPTPPVVPISPASPSGWFGFSIRCSDCGWSVTRGDDSPVWESDSAPELSMIAAGGPASRAGLLAGDRITHIDGLSILSSAGARKFGHVRPGQTVRLTVLRDGVPLTRQLTLATRPEIRAAMAVVTAPRAAATRRELRYTGQLDHVSVEVWSAGGPTVERVGDTMVITTGTSVVRLKVKK